MPVYATFGFGFFDREQLAAAAKLWVSQGFRRLKMTVGNEALRHRDARPVMDVIREDAARVRAVREAVGPDVELFIDANCNLDLYHATKLVEMIKPLGISFFEEPLTQNDVPADGAASPLDRHGAGLRPERGAGVSLPRSAGGARRSTMRSRTSRSPAASPSACEIAGLAVSLQRARSPTAAPGASTTCTCRPASRTARWSSTTISRSNCSKQIYRGLPMPADGWLTMPDTPGLGFEPNRDAIREIVALSPARTD